jgi:HAD superfamily hydrolase (TIGR01484 family)
MGEALIPISQLCAAQAAAIHTFITDVDDTVTTDGVLTADAYTAMERLRQSGLRVIVTTGRPAGWCDHIARMWPVDAVVVENGAACFQYDRQARKLRCQHSLEGDGFRLNRERIETVAQAVLKGVPGAALASDQFCRLYDLAIDFCEDVPRLNDADVNEIVRIMEAAGMTVKISSIHVNGWFGNYDKLSMTRTLMQDVHGVDMDAQREQFMYAGDSPNDAPMFAHFPFSVGVANVKNFFGKMQSLPKYVTQGYSGKGFTELADLLIALRSAAA